MTIEEKLRMLCEASGASGNESGVCRAAETLLREYTDDVRTDINQNVIANIYDAGEGKPRLMLDAHLDEVGLIVTHIDDDGFIRVSGVGGVDRRLFPAQEVTIHGREDVPGVILTEVPFLTEPDQKNKVPSMDSVFIDTGYSREALEKLIMPGDFITFSGPFTRLQGDHITSRAMDDRSCAVCILAALEHLKGKELPVSLSVLFSSQEEVGCRGAVTGAYSVNPDMAIAVDVSFAMTPDADPNLCGELGKGPMIGWSPVLDRRISSRLTALAKEQNIPFQTEIMGGSTGTNADGIALTRGGVRTGLVSLPERNMHMPVEVIRLCDIEASGRLLAAYILDPAL